MDGDRDKMLLQQIKASARWLEIAMASLGPAAFGQSLTTAATVLAGPHNTYLLACELESNTGPSISDAAEALYPELIRQLKLNPLHLVVVEIQPPRPALHIPDPTFDQVLLPGAQRDTVGWKPLSWDMARELYGLGVTLTTLTGQWVSALDADSRDGFRRRHGVVLGYNGRAYILSDDPTMPVLPPLVLSDPPIA